MITADGLPYRDMMDLIMNSFDCAECDEKFDHMANVNEHMKNKQHKQYYQRFGSIVPNLGQFHYLLTLMRSYIKMIWNVDLSDLAKAINLDSPKAQFMVQHCTNLRKVLDCVRAAREARKREMVLPFIKQCLEEETEISLENFFLWLKNVKDQTYRTVYNLESKFGTALSLFHASMRANNLALLKVSKRFLSPLFHVNGNHMYSPMDIHQDYLFEMMEQQVPDLNSYMEDKYFINFSGKDYHASPHDERHEEFNKVSPTELTTCGSTQNDDLN